jgi:hypothetical protein
MDKRKEHNKNDGKGNRKYISARVEEKRNIQRDHSPISDRSTAP